MIILRLALRNAITRPLTIILVLLVPLGALVLNLLGTTPRDDEQTELLRGAVVDRDGTIRSRGLEEALSRSIGPVVSAESREIMYLLVEEEVHYAVIVPAGYGDALGGNGERAAPPLKILSPGDEAIHTTVERVLHRYHREVSAPDGDAATAGGAPDDAAAGKDAAPGDAATAGGALMPDPPRSQELSLAVTPVRPVRTLLGVLILTLLLCAVFNGFDIVRAREQHVLHRLLAAPGGTAVYVAQQGLALAFVAVAQAMVGTTAIAVAFRIDLPGALRLAVVVSLFGLTAAALALAIAGRTKTLGGAAVAAGFLVMPLVMAGGAFWSRDSLPPAVSRAGYFFPTTWAIVTLEGVLDGAPLVSYSVNLLALGLFTVLLALLGPWTREDLEFT